MQFLMVFVEVMMSILSNSSSQGNAAKERYNKINMDSLQRCRRPFPWMYRCRTRLSLYQLAT